MQLTLHCVEALTALWVNFWSTGKGPEIWEVCFWLGHWDFMDFESFGSRIKGKVGFTLQILKWEEPILEIFDIQRSRKHLSRQCPSFRGTLRTLTQNFHVKEAYKGNSRAKQPNLCIVKSLMRLQKIYFSNNEFLWGPKIIKTP